MGSHTNQSLRMFKVACVCAIVLAASVAAEERGSRQPKLFFVTSSTSTTITTSTSLLSDTLTCFMFSSTTYMGCTGRKKRAVSLVEDKAEDIVMNPAIRVSRVSREAEEAAPAVESSALEEKQGEREARFAWYYMTTTVTSTSTGTVSILLQSCTPSQFVACGGK